MGGVGRGGARQGVGVGGTEGDELQLKLCGIHKNTTKTGGCSCVLMYLLSKIIEIV
jgi:hypothetical protein